MLKSTEVWSSFLTCLPSTAVDFGIKTTFLMLVERSLVAQAA